ncbi:hypothetical protein VP01_2740g3 [Puccinia sorghi]|uniref:Uncharacterized protein n=1 Tax=Puccinia sorghi TaxID=27349 RepID=A0A0L6V4Y8_9BASI|nr:hypothetical protein VP01_2740g3 [Puccinia sorghi]
MIMTSSHVDTKLPELPPLPDQMTPETWWFDDGIHHQHHATLPGYHAMSTSWDSHDDFHTFSAWAADYHHEPTGFISPIATQPHSPFLPLTAPEISAASHAQITNYESLGGEILPHGREELLSQSFSFWRSNPPIIHDHHESLGYKHLSSTPEAPLMPPVGMQPLPYHGSTDPTAVDGAPSSHMQLPESFKQSPWSTMIPPAAQSKPSGGSGGNRNKKTRPALDDQTSTPPPKRSTVRHPGKLTQAYCPQVSSSLPHTLARDPLSPDTPPDFMAHLLVSSSLHPPHAPLQPTRAVNPLQRLPFHALMFHVSCFAPLDPCDQHQARAVRILREKLQDFPENMLVVSSAMPAVPLQDNPEKKMLEKVIEKFRDLTQERGLSREKRQERFASRNKRLKAVLGIFQKDIHGWHKRWAGLTGMNMLLPDGLGNKRRRLRLVFCLFLFYVEMITTIVPRRSSREPPVDLLTELCQAWKSFVLLSDIATQPLDPSTVMEPQMERVVMTLARQWNPTRKSKSPMTHVILWSYLDYYLCTFRPGIFHDGPSKALKTSPKSFFNKIFMYSYAYLRLIHVPRPVS